MIRKAFALTVVAILILSFAACTFVADDENNNDYPGKVPAESIELSNSVLDMHVGESFDLNAQLFPSNTYDTVSFSSDNDRVVSVNELGEITAIRPGNATVYAKAGFLSASCRITVSYPPALSISANTEVLNLKVSESFRLEAEVFPENANCSKIQFFSDDERIATVDENGLVTAVGVGYTSIGIYVPETPRVRCVVEVNTFSDSIAKMNFDARCYPVLKNGTASLDLTIEPFGTSADKITYTSHDENIVSVDANGIIYGNNYGTTVISASTPDGITAQCIATVTSRLAPDPANPISVPRYKAGDFGYTRSLENSSKEVTIMLAGAVYADAQRQNDAQFGGKFDFNESFRYLKRIFSSSDLNVASLNSTLSYSYEYACERGDKNNSPSSLLEAVRYAGIDAIAAAGLTDLGLNEQYTLETAEQLDRYGLMHTGINAFSDEVCGLMAGTNGINICVLSYALSSDRKGVSEYSLKRASDDVSAAKKAGADIIIVYLDSKSVNDEKLEAVFYELANIGVDTAVGVDPKRLGSAEYIQGSNDKPMLAVYSLGSITADSDSSTGNDSIILKLTVKKDSKAVISTAEYIPIRLIGSYDGSSYVSVPAIENDAKDSSLTLKFSAERINDLMGSVLNQAEL